MRRLTGVARLLDVVDLHDTDRIDDSIARGLVADWARLEKGLATSGASFQ